MRNTVLILMFCAIVVSASAIISFDSFSIWFSGLTIGIAFAAAVQWGGIVLAERMK